MIIDSGLAALFGTIVGGTITLFVAASTQRRIDERDKEDRRRLAAATRAVIGGISDTLSDLLTITANSEHPRVFVAAIQRDLVRMRSITDDTGLMMRLLPAESRPLIQLLGRAEHVYSETFSPDDKNLKEISAELRNQFIQIDKISGAMADLANAELESSVPWRLFVEFVCRAKANAANNRDTGNKQ